MAIKQILTIDLTICVWPLLAISVSMMFGSERVVANPEFSSKIPFLAFPINLFSRCCNFSHFAACKFHVFSLSYTIPEMKLPFVANNLVLFPCLVFTPDVWSSYAQVRCPLPPPPLNTFPTPSPKLYIIWRWLFTM